MNKNDLVHRVYSVIVLLDTSNEKLSIRKIAKILGKQNSLYSIQLSIQKLVDEWKLIKNDMWKIEMNYWKFNW